MPPSNASGNVQEKKNQRAAGSGWLRPLLQADAAVRRWIAFGPAIEKCAIKPEN